MSTELGSRAEQLVVKLLQSQGHVILAKNWKTRWCEIDIISRYKGVLFFIEVKYRSSDVWGGGLSYITERKIEQMRFSAENWLHMNKWRGECTLLAAEVNADNAITLVEV